MKTSPLVVWLPVVLGVFTTEEKALAAFESIPVEDGELTVEEWPADSLAARYSVMVIAHK